MPVPNGYKNIDQDKVNKYDDIVEVINKGNNNFKEQIFEIRAIIANMD